MQKPSLFKPIDRIYLDHNATTPHAPVLRERWSELFLIAGNPSSIHNESRIPKTWLRETRQKLANYLNCSPLEIIFNSGASEGNSSILKSVWQT
jgi:cysteine desulfurase